MKAFSFREAEASPGFLLWRTTNIWQREIRRKLNEFNLTHAQFVVLASSLWLSHDRELAQIDIATHAGMDVMTTSQVIRTLEKKKYLARSQSSIDTRAKSIVVTSAGKKILERALPVVENFDRVFF